MTDLIPQQDKLLDVDAFQEKFQRLIDHHLDSVLHLITRIRAYHDGLTFCDRLDLLNTNYLVTQKQSAVRNRFNDREIILFRLTMLDKLDYYKEYIDLFETVRETKTDSEYTIHRGEWYMKPYLEPYVMHRIDEDNVYLHFLFLQRDRYDLIREKWRRFQSNALMENLQHKRQAQLGEEERHQRFLDAMERMQYRLIYNIKL